LLIFSVFCVVLFVFVMCLVFDVSRASGLSILHCLLQFSLTLIADDYKKIKIVAMHDLYLGQQ
jgi:UDP-N-acetylmuramyl pentapeptide phosphotransferase/UDP-N-acetylglucosamine-1-phosphate transferase